MKVSDIIKHFGTKARLAQELGITKQSVSGWGDGEIPEKQALKLEHVVIPRLTNSPSVQVNPESFAASEV